jgi:putative oxidoreductase
MDALLYAPEAFMALESTTTTTVSRSSGPASVGLLLGRIPLGLFFVMAGIAKFYYGLDNFIKVNLPDAMKFLPEHLARGFLNALPFVEIAVGTLLIVGLLTRIAAGIMVLLLLSITIAHSPHLAGVGGGPFNYTLVYIGLALAIMLVGPGWFSIDGLLFRPRRRVIVTDDIERPAGP